MGFFEKLKRIFTIPEDAPVEKENSYEKSMLRDEISSLLVKLECKNPFDSTVRYLKQTMVFDKSVDELKSIRSNLENKIAEYDERRRRTAKEREDLEACKWTGQRPKGMSSEDLDRWQRSDDR